MRNSNKKTISRRQFLKASTFAGATALLAACAGAATPAPTQAPQPTTAPTTAPATAAATDTAAPTTAATAAATDTVAPTAAATAAATTAPATKAGEFHGAFPYQVPPTGNWNSYSPDGIPNGIAIYQDLLEEPLARYKWASGDYVGHLATKWAFNGGDKFDVTVRDAKWSDGNPVTSKDVVATFNVGKLFNWTVFNYVDTVTATDDKNVEFHMTKPSTLVARLVLVTNIRSAAT
jgi:peptide/nickel transport system substrate-binding protein